MDPRQVLGNVDDETLITWASMRMNELLKGDAPFNHMVNEIIIRRTGLDGLNPATALNPAVTQTGVDVLFDVLALYGQGLSTVAGRLTDTPDEPGYL
jgi:hypothetical protein